MNEIHLKPCPFCGGDAETYNKFVDIFMVDFWVRGFNWKAENQHFTQEVHTTAKEEFEIGKGLTIDL